MILAQISDMHITAEGRLAYRKSACLLTDLPAERLLSQIDRKSVV